MAFPYWTKSLMTPNDMFYNLKNQELHIVKDDQDNQVLKRHYPDDYFNCDHISNHFTENIRITCQFGTYTTPYDTWEQVKDEEDIKKMTPLEQREYIYSSTRECNTFNVTFCLWIYRTLTELSGIQRAAILDPSSGWGDRLIAALACNALVYHGYDPNKDLQKGYKKIIKTLNEDTKATIKCIPFEEAKIKFNYYDIVLTSPPYFDLEKYGDSSEQSIIKYPSYTNWLNQFYRPYLIKMILVVKSKGFIVVYIENITSKNVRYNLREYTINTIESTNNVEYYTKYGLKVGKSIRYALVWRKK